MIIINLKLLQLERITIKINKAIQWRNTCEIIIIVNYTRI